MKLLMQCQFRKLFHRGEIFVIAAIVAAFPLLFAYLIGSGSDAIQTQLETVDGISFLYVMLGFFNALYGLYIISALYTVLLVSNEIESGYEGLVLSRYASKNKLLLSKFISIVCVCAAYLILFILTACVAWFVFIKNSAFGGDGTFASFREQIPTVAAIFVLVLLESGVMTAVFSVVNMYLGQIKAILASVAVTIGLEMLGRVRTIGKYVPHKLSDPITYTNDVGVLDLPQMIFRICILCVCAGVTLSFALYKYRHMDYIKRGG
jgi:ABC-type transport system involved in multi-copper enzyme maturation permease subunit